MNVQEQNSLERTKISKMDMCIVVEGKKASEVEVVEHINFKWLMKEDANVRVNRQS
jgi:hypothetical protein